MNNKQTFMGQLERKVIKEMVNVLEGYTFVKDGVEKHLKVIVVDTNSRNKSEIHIEGFIG